MYVQSFYLLTIFIFIFYHFINVTWQQLLPFPLPSRILLIFGPHLHFTMNPVSPQQAFIKYLQYFISLYFIIIIYVFIVLKMKLFYINYNTALKFLI